MEPPHRRRGLQQPAGALDGHKGLGVGRPAGPPTRPAGYPLGASVAVGLSLPDLRSQQQTWPVGLPHFDFLAVSSLLSFSKHPYSYGLREESQGS